MKNMSGQMTDSIEEANWKTFGEPYTKDNLLLKFALPYVTIGY